MKGREGSRQILGGPGSKSGTLSRLGRESAFTLVEVMLAISLVGIIMALAYGGFQASVRATTSGEALIEETNQLRVTHQFVRRQLSLAQSLIIEESEEDEFQVRFEGERDRVRFVAPMPGYLSFGGPYVQQLSIERGREGYELVFYFAMLNGYEPGEIEASEGIVLLENLRGGQFLFLGQDEEEMDTFWDEFWEETDRLPLAVILDLDLGRVNGLVWPELFAPVMIDSGPPQARRREIQRASDLMVPRDQRPRRN
ncbi:MAG: prepilin-type N-terminal cleavage/methylation domain-containing protein [Wenzhouxiangella sp.]